MPPTPHTASYFSNCNDTARSKFRKSVMFAKNVILLIKYSRCWKTFARKTVTRCSSAGDSNERKIYRESERKQKQKMKQQQQNNNNETKCETIYGSGKTIIKSNKCEEKIRNWLREVDMNVICALVQSLPPAHSSHCC